MPISTINANSLAFMPCGDTPVSVPNAIGTPNFNAERNMRSCSVSVARALAAMAGGYFDGHLVHPIDRQTRRHQVGALGLHQLQRLVAEEAAVLDGIHAGLDRLPGGEIAMGMGGDFSLPGMGFRNDGAQFIRRELRHVHRVRL